MKDESRTGGLVLTPVHFFLSRFRHLKLASTFTNPSSIYPHAPPPPKRKESCIPATDPAEKPPERPSRARNSQQIARSSAGSRTPSRLRLDPTTQLRSPRQRLKVGKSGIEGGGRIVPTPRPAPDERRSASAILGLMRTFLEDVSQEVKAAERSMKGSSRSID